MGRSKGRWAAVLVAAAWCGGELSAQTAKAKAAPPKTPPGKKAAAEGKDTPVSAALPANAESITLRTEDGVYLVGTYFRARTGKATGALVIPNFAPQTQRELYPLAAELSGEDGVSVFTFDFRGFGQSTALATDSPLVKRPGDSPRLRNEDVLRNPTSLLLDLDAVKQFLLHENNDNALNIRQFGLLAFGALPSAAALSWTMSREFAPDPQWTREGGDLAALCLVSPALVYKQLKVPGTLQFAGAWGAKLPTMVVSVAGKTPGHEAAEKIARALKLAVLGEGDPNDKRYRKNAGWLKVATVATDKGKVADLGIETLRAPELAKTRVDLRGFFKAHLAARKEAPWEGLRTVNDEVKIAFRKRNEAQAP